MLRDRQEGSNWVANGWVANGWVANGWVANGWVANGWAAIGWVANPGYQTGGQLEGTGKMPVQEAVF